MKLKTVENTLRSHPFVTSWYLQNYNIQTFFGSYFPYFQIAQMKKFERRYIDLPDGSKLAAECWLQKNPDTQATIIILNGVEGYWANGSLFATSMAYKAYLFGYNVIHLKQRGEGDTIHLAKAVFNEFLENDLTVAIEQFITWGLKKIYLIGVSGGGGLVLRELASSSKNILGGVAISAPVNTFNIWKQVEKRPHYNYLALKAYKIMTKRRLEFDTPKTWDKKRLKKIKTKRQWFDTYMHLWGYPEKFSSFEEYVAKTNVEPLLPTIKIPTLIIHAYDDPITMIDPYMHLNNPSVIKLLTKHGGHGTFFTTKRLYGDLDGHWAQNRAMEFIKLLED